eukprot:g9746.t1
MLTADVSAAVPSPDHASASRARLLPRLFLLVLIRKTTGSCMQPTCSNPSPYRSIPLLDRSGLKKSLEMIYFKLCDKLSERNSSGSNKRIKLWRSKVFGACSGIAFNAFKPSDHRNLLKNSTKG